MYLLIFTTWQPSTNIYRKAIITPKNSYWIGCLTQKFILASGIFQIELLKRKHVLLYKHVFDEYVKNDEQQTAFSGEVGQGLIAEVIFLTGGVTEKT